MSNSVPSITVKSIKFKNGTDEIQFSGDDIVLLVGANNVGKSRTPKDLQEDLIGEDVPKVLIDEVGYRTAEFTADQLRSYFERNISKDEFGNYTVFVREDIPYSYSESEFDAILDGNK